jgi:hypothetical protein
MRSREPRWRHPDAGHAVAADTSLQVAEVRTAINEFLVRYAGGA